MLIHNCPLLHVFRQKEIIFHQIYSCKPKHIIAFLLTPSFCGAAEMQRFSDSPRAGRLQVSPTLLLVVSGWSCVCV